MTPLSIVILGLSITSSWGNGHATTYRALVRALADRGHDVLFLEADRPWYAANRDLPHPPFGRTELYESLDDLRDRFGHAVRHADLVIVGSYVPDGVEVGRWAIATAQGVTAFYDIDTPVTLAKLERGDTEYLSPDLIPRYCMYLSFTGGPTLQRLERQYGSPMARALYCSVDPERYRPEPAEPAGTWAISARTATTGSRPSTACWSNPRGRGARGVSWWRVLSIPAPLSGRRTWQRIEHLPPADHSAFYNAQRFTLNVTRADMIAAGWSPSVRLFEAAACGTPIISDWWAGLDSLFDPGGEIVIAPDTATVLETLRTMPDRDRQAMGKRARDRILSSHTAAHRAMELERYVAQARETSFLVKQSGDVWAPLRGALQPAMARICFNIPTILYKLHIPLGLAYIRDEPWNQRSSMTAFACAITAS